MVRGGTFQVAQSDTIRSSLGAMGLVLILAACGATRNHPDPGDSSTTGGTGGSGGSGGGETSSAGNASTGGAAGGGAAGTGSVVCPSEPPEPWSSCPHEDGLDCDYLDEEGCDRLFSCGYHETSIPVWVPSSVVLVGACETPGTTCEYSTPSNYDTLISEYACGDDLTWKQPGCPLALPEKGDPCTGSGKLSYYPTCIYDFGCSAGMHHRGQARCQTCPDSSTECTYVVTEWDFADDACAP
jgi:hypothetical protein